MKAPLVVLCALLLFCPTFAANQPSKSDSQVLVAQGTLSQQSDLHWQVIADRKVELQGNKVERLRFTVSTVDQATWCLKYEGKRVEVSGEVEVLDRGVATIKLHTISFGDPIENSPAEAIRKFLTKSLPDPSNYAPGQPLYRFGYYLVLLDPPDGCERCYVPLLITPDPITEAARRRESLDAVWITTYERDSIWQTHGLITLAPAALESVSQTILFRGKRYRYQPASNADVLRLLQSPAGTIPISRVYLPNTVAPGASLKELINNSQTILRVRERKGGGFIHYTEPKGKSGSAPATAIEDSGSTSGLTVLEDGKVQYRLAPRCSKRFAILPGRSHVGSESWNWRETCPGSQDSEKLYEYALTPKDLSQLKGLLEREEIKQVRGCFCNAGPGLGDYAIEIPRPDSTQKMSAVAFLPQHFELREHPAMTYVICAARKIQQQVTHEATPGWCENLPPLK